MKFIMYIADDIGIKELDVMFEEIQIKYKHLYVDIGVELEDKDMIPIKDLTKTLR
jgi:hypothetical protein